MSFHKAVRRQHKLRVALTGPKGAGKTVLGMRMLGALGRRVAVIDGDRGAAEVYVGEEGIPEFDLVVLRSQHPRAYINAVRDAERDGFDAIMVDNLSGAWTGLLELVDRSPDRWKDKDVTALAASLVDTIHGCRAHLVCTLRSRMEYVVDQLDGGATARRLGLAPEQKQGIEYEFGVLGDIDASHAVRFTGRCMALDGQRFEDPDGAALGYQLLAWASAGAPMDPYPKNKFGIVLPRGPCPKLKEGRGGRLWSELSIAQVAKLLEQHGGKMTPDQRDWAEYLLTTDQARKAAESAQAAEVARRRAEAERLQAAEAAEAAELAANVNQDAEPPP